MVSAHGDRKSPGVVGPLPNGLNGLYMGVTNYLLSGVILQVPMRSTGVSSNILQVNWLALNIAARKLAILEY